MNMKKFSHIMSALFILIGFAAMNVQNSFAQTPTPTGNTPTPASGVSFTMLGQTEVALQGPLDIQSFSFNIPADWQLTDGGQLHLDYNVFGESNTTNVNGTVPIATSYIDVSLNGKPVGTVVLSQNGEGSADFTIPTSDWTTTDPNSPTKSLQFFLRTPNECNPTTVSEIANITNTGLSATIHATSYFVLPHNTVSISTDLRRIPYPIYQDSFIPDKAILVVPDNPSEAELQAAFTTSAALGRLTSGSLSLDFTTASKLNPTRLADSHLIYVGKASSFPQLSTYPWPAPFQGQGFSSSQIGTDDGVLQEIASPQNPSRAWLLISGQSDNAVVKASQVLGSGEIRVGSQSNLAVISTIQNLTQNQSSIADHTFTNLGYPTQTLYGPGIRYLGYHFQIPAGKSAADGAYLGLTFSNSAMFDFQQSGVSISLNDAHIGSFRFSDRTTQISTWQLNLPAYSFHAGDNFLLVEANLEPVTFCIPNQELWFTTSSESVLHVPLMDALPVQSATNLSDYPAPFTPDLSHMAFVVAHNDPDGWSAASMLAYNLGLNTGGTLIDPVMAYADNVPDSIRQQRDLLIVGRPSTLPIMKDLSTSIPAPFPAGSDIATEQGTQFNFHVPSNTPVGYLQIFTSPWNQQHTVVTVSGNGADGLNWGTAAFINPALRTQLNGNMAVLYNNNQVIAAQISLASASSSSASTPVAIATQAVVSSNPSAQNSSNLLLISTAAVLVLAILGFLVWFLGRRRNQ